MREAASGCLPGHCQRYDNGQRRPAVHNRATSRARQRVRWTAPNRHHPRQVGCTPPSSCEAELKRRAGAVARACPAEVPLLRDRRWVYEDAVDDVAPIRGTAPQAPLDEHVAQMSVAVGDRFVTFVVTFREPRRCPDCDWGGPVVTSDGRVLQHRGSMLHGGINGSSVYPAPEKVCLYPPVARSVVPLWTTRPARPARMLRRCRADRVRFRHAEHLLAAWRAVTTPTTHLAQHGHEAPAPRCRPGTSPATQ